MLCHSLKTRWFNHPSLCPEEDVPVESCFWKLLRELRQSVKVWLGFCSSRAWVVLATSIWNSSNRWDSEGHVIDLHLCFSVSIVVQFTHQREMLLRVRQSCRLRFDLIEELILQLLDWVSVASLLPQPQAFISQLPPHSLVLDLATTWCWDASVQLTPRRVVANQPGQRAGPVPQAREGTQPPLYSATDSAVSLAFGQVGSPGFFHRHCKVFTACIWPQ